MLRLRSLKRRGALLDPRLAQLLSAKLQILISTYPLKAARVAITEASRVLSIATRLPKRPFAKYKRLRLTTTRLRTRSLSLSRSSTRLSILVREKVTLP
jgi:hypothetical protein